MHMIIRNIVYAKNKVEALQKAKENMDYMVGDSGNEPFDYYVTFNHEGTPVSGKGRWGRGIPSVIKVDTSVGKKLIKEGWDWTKSTFRKNIDKVTTLIKDTDNVMDLMEDSTFRCYSNWIGQYSGSEVWLYDGDGSGITNKTHLKNVLKKWSCLYEDEGKPNPYINDNIYVVPADVHH